MKSLTRTSNLPIFGLLGLVFIVVALWIAFGLAAGLGATGAAFLVLDYRMGEDE